jgi:hypothetical protein
MLVGPSLVYIYIHSRKRRPMSVGTGSTPNLITRVSVWVEDDDITMAEFQSERPAIDRLFVCRVGHSIKLFKELLRLKLVERHPNGGFHFQGDLIEELELYAPPVCFCKNPYECDGIAYQVWGPMNSASGHHLAEKKHLIDHAIGNANKTVHQSKS